MFARHALLLKACGVFRPGEETQCAKLEVSDERVVEEVGRILRLPRDKIGIVMEPNGGKDFKIVGLSMQLLKGPGIGERGASGDEVAMFGEALTEVSWTYSLKNREVRLRICGKLANPEFTGCAERQVKNKGIRQLLGILLLEPVERLIFNLGWDGAAKKFTKVRRISINTK